MRFFSNSIVFLLALSASATLLAQQTTQPEPNNPAQTPGIVIKPLKNKQLVPAIPLNAGIAGRKATLDFRTEAEMTPEDHALVLNAEGTIAERARFNDLDFDARPENPWKMQQAVCPALPRHILVQFTRGGEHGDRSVFTAVIPRDPSGRIRIIPVERKGYSLFSPAPINAITINLFNRIRDDEKQSAAPDWLTLGLCYASMAGVRPKADLIAANIETEKLPEARPATLELLPTGVERLYFVDMNALPAPMEWTMQFSKTGRLLKATHKKAIITKFTGKKQQIIDVK